MKLIYLLCILLLLSACQSENTEKTQVPTSPSELIEAEKARAKTAALLEKYPSEDGYIKLGWDVLMNMEFDVRFVDSLDGNVPFPIFNEVVKELDKELVVVEGYVIPFEETGDASIIFLSAFPYTQCFFCGAAGPESVIDILSEEKLEDLKMDEKTTFRGRLRLNDTDLDYLNYIMTEAELVSM